MRSMKISVALVILVIITMSLVPLGSGPISAGNLSATTVSPKAVKGLNEIEGAIDRPTELFNGTVVLTEGNNITFNPGTMNYSIAETTDLGVLLESRLPFSADDSFYASFNSFRLDSISNISGNWTHGPNWFIVINGAEAAKGLGSNNVSNGDRLQFIFCPYGPNFEPALDQAKYVIIIEVKTVQGVSPTDWARFQHDAFNSGVTSEPGPRTNNGTPLFATQTTYQAQDGGIDSEPLVYGNTVYVVSHGGTVTAIDRVSGEIRWQSAVGGRFALATPVIANGKLFMGTSDGHLAAFNTSSGERLWMVGDGQLGQVNTPIVYDNGKVYFGTFNATASSGAYYCYSEGGEEVWSYPAEGFYWAGASLIGDHIVFGGDDGYLTSLDKVTGALIDRVNCDDIYGFNVTYIRSSLSYESANGRLYFTSVDGYCYLIGYDADIGKFRTNVTNSTYIGASTSTPSIYKDRLYVGTIRPNESLVCLDTQNLNKIWVYNTTGPVESSPAISTFYDNGSGEVYIYFTTNDAAGALYCLKDVANSTSPQLQFIFKPRQAEFALQGPAISNGTAYYGNDAGYLFGLMQSA